MHGENLKLKSPCKYMLQILSYTNLYFSYSPAFCLSYFTHDSSHSLLLKPIIPLAIILTLYINYQLLMPSLLRKHYTVYHYIAEINCDPFT